MQQEELRLPTGLPDDYRETARGGLTEEEAARRKADGRANEMPADDGKPTSRIISENVFTLFNGINLLLALWVLSVRSYRNLIFLPIVIVNTVISIYHEIRSRNVIRKMKLLNAGRAHVIRGGHLTEIAPEDIVEGDLIVLHAGDQVAADCIAVSGSGAAIESLLTGESDPIPKTEGDWLYSGSCLATGRIVCQAVHVGAESYVGQLTRTAKKHREPKSGLMLELDRLIRWVTIFLIPMGALLYLRQTFLQHLPPETAVPSTAAALLGMIPEGLVLLTSVAMATGVVTLARKKVLVQELYGIETLARVDTLCLDKTGTLTSGRMQVEEIVPLDVSRGEAEAALSRFLGAFDEDTGTLNALRKAVSSGSEAPLCVMPFSSDTKKSAASFRGGKTLILGAADFVLEGGCPEALAGEVSRRAAEGRRVLLLAEADGVISGDTLPPVTRLMALFCLTDEMRPHVTDTTRYFREEGVTLKVISGDDPLTVSRVAAAAGIEHADRVVDAQTLTTPEEIRAACEKYTVFGRVTPAQKKEIVNALQAAGHTVGMTGDGVNDIPALRAADCSIAMAQGADAARSAAQLTLLESDFAVVPQIVLEGRRVINNITRSATLFLTKTIFSFLLSLLTLTLSGIYPFQPIQMSLVSDCVIGIPGFFLSLEPNRERIHGSFLRTVFGRALPGGVAVAATATVAMLQTNAGMDSAVCSTLATWLAGGVGLMVLIHIICPPDLYRIIVTAGCAALFVLAGLFFGPVFFLTPLTGSQTATFWLLVLLAAVLYWGIFFLEKFIAARYAARKRA